MGSSILFVMVDDMGEFYVDVVPMGECVCVCVGCV